MCYSIYRVEGDIIYKLFTSKEIKPGYLYFYIHFIIEVACFYFLTRVTADHWIVWLIPLFYDAFAFVPQGLIGYLNDLYPKLKIDLIGIILLILSYLVYLLFDISIYYSLILLCLGNACLHITGAEVTLRNSNGKLSSPAIFVAGGSFGVITGKLLAKYNLNPYIIIILILSMIPFILLANTYKDKKNKECKYNYVKKLNPVLILFLATLVVVVRGYMGYGIPTSWNKTTFQTIILFVSMGIGKALGGILSDLFGIRKVGILSTLIAIPFLAFGDNIMLISLIGVMFFSMTMAITLAIIVSVLKKHPGLAFGFTTIGLFLGTVPIFFIKIPSVIVNIIMISILSLLCSLALGYMLKKESKT